jgi:hypothetical protein
MALPKAVESLTQRYEKSAIVRALVQLIPLSIGSAIDTAVLTKVQSIRADRMREFFDELARGEQELNPELLENNDFLHCFFATSEAALKTQREEKIRAFARLLCASTIQGKFSDIDEYEEFLAILDDLSNRELAVLILLDSYESIYQKNEEENDFQRANRFWQEFCHQLVTEFGIPDNEINAILTRLNRSGCYETFTGTYWDNTGGKGKITPTFHRIKTLALEP